MALMKMWDVEFIKVRETGHDYQ